MANFYGILLIGTLVVASGVIAYVGDIVGRRMGRKRLSLFGMRPRHTAIAVSVMAGMLITMFTLAAAMLASRDVRQGLLNAAAMRRQQAELKRDLDQTQARVKSLDTSRREAERKVAEARKGVEEADRSLQEAKAKYEETDQRRAKAEAELKDRQAKLKELEAEQVRLEKLVTRVSRDLVLAQREYRRELDRLAQRTADVVNVVREDRVTPVLVVAGEPLDVELIQGGQSNPAIRAQLNEMLARLTAKARQAGAAPLPGGDDAVVLDKFVTDPKTGGIAKFTKQQVLVAVTNEIARAQGGVIARAESAINSYADEPIYADIKLYNNRLVYHKGEVLAEAVVDGSRPQPALMNALVGLLKAKVGPDAKRKNMMPRITSTGSDPFGSSGSTVGEMSYDQLFEKIAELRRIGGSAKVVVFAAEDAWTIGPLTVDMRIEPASG